MVTPTHTALTPLQWRVDRSRSGRVRRTFIKLPATVAVVTSIDPEHLDYYGDFEALKHSLSNSSKYSVFGFATMCIDDEKVQALISKVSNRRIITYGLNPRQIYVQ